jgi:hypothetical protein
MGNPLEEKISINNLISGFANYLQTLKAIAQKPLSFPDGLDLSAEDAFQQALAFMFYSLVLMFFYLDSYFFQVWGGGIKSHFFTQVFDSIWHLYLNVASQPKAVWGKPKFKANGCCLLAHHRLWRTTVFNPGLSYVAGFWPSGHLGHNGRCSEVACFFS